MPETELVIRTPRLDLIAATLTHIDAELRSRAALEHLLQARVPSDWPPGEYDRSAQESFRTQLASGDPSLVGWLAWYAVTRSVAGQRDTLIAGAGFLGRPAQGAVELGYSVVPAARGQGYATEVVQALLAHAFTTPDVRAVIAHTSDENVASVRVLVRCGFRRVGPGPELDSVEYRRERTPYA
jgi:ribosomal-protein-alanine N-acetyltransferase